MTKRVLVFLLCKTLFVGCLVAQDIHFSQFYANPLTVNPAQTAWYDGNFRANCVYRTQWKSIDNTPYQTVSVSLEKQFHLSDHTYGFGLLALRDESGYSNLTVDKLLTSGAFSLNVDGHSLSCGLQLGLVYKSTNADKYTYDEQYDFGGDDVFNRDFASGELGDEPIFHAAINAGVQWRKQLTYNYVANIGVALFNINTPYESFYGVELENTEQALRYAVQVGGDYTIRKKIFFHPNVLYMMQKGATDFLFGGNVEYALQPRLHVYGGGLFRYGWENNTDASIWIVGAKFKRLDVGLSYDVNLSSLHKATNCRGAFEVSVTYLSPTWKSTNVKIPCERI